MGIIENLNILEPGAPIYASDHQENFEALSNAINNITGEQIFNGEITKTKVKDASIVNRNIADNTLIADHIVSGEITTSKILDGSITAEKIAGFAEIPYVQAGVVKSIDANGYIQFERPFEHPPIVLVSNYLYNESAIVNDDRKFPTSHLVDTYLGPPRPNRLPPSQTYSWVEERLDEELQNNGPEYQFLWYNEFPAFWNYSTKDGFYYFSGHTSTWGDKTLLGYMQWIAIDKNMQTSWADYVPSV